MKKSIVTAVAAASLLACGKHEAQPQPKKQLPAATVQVIEVTEREDPGYLVTIGRVKNVRESMVAAKVMGRVLRIEVKAGDMVRKGQRLMRIDARDARARFNQARGALTQAQAAQTIARQMLNRFKALQAKDAASKAKYDQAVFDFNRASGAVTQAQGAMSQARSYLQESTVTAPFAGRVVDTMIEQGEMANPGMPLLRIESDASLEFETQVNSQDVFQLKVGEKVQVELDAERDDRRKLEGTISEIVPSADMMTHSNVVRVDLGAEPWVRSGMFGRAFFKRTKSTGGTIVVDEARVVRRGQLHGVYIVDASKHVRLRLVRPGRAVAGKVEILAGLSKGDQLVTSDNKGLIDGQPATVSK